MAVTFGVARECLWQGLQLALVFMGWHILPGLFREAKGHSR